MLCGNNEHMYFYSNILCMFNNLYIQQINLHCYECTTCTTLCFQCLKLHGVKLLNFLLWSTLVSATLCVSLWSLPAHSWLLIFLSELLDSDRGRGYVRNGPLQAHLPTPTMRHKYILVKQHGRLLPFLSLKLLQPVSTAWGSWSRQTADQLFSIGPLADGK